MIDGQLALNGNPDLKDFERSIESYRRNRNPAYPNNWYVLLANYTIGSALG